MKRLISILLIVGCTSSMIAETTTWNSQLQHVFGDLIHPTNYLYDKTIHVLDEEYFSNECQLVADYDKWYYAYDEMYNAAKDTSVLLPPNSVVELALKYRRDTIQIGIIDLNFARLNEDALTSEIYFEFQYDENKLVDRYDYSNGINTGSSKSAPVTPEPIGTPYTIHNIFMVSPTLSATHTLRPVFNIGELTFMDLSIQTDYTDGDLQLLIDFGDGSGMREISVSETHSISVEYSEPGEYQIEAVALLNGEEIKRSISKILVGDEFSIEDLEELGVIVNTMTDLQSHGLNVFEYISTCHYAQSEEKVIFIVSGYNALSFSDKYGKRDALELYEKYVLNGNLHNLLSFGYKFVIIDWQYPNDDIVENARRLKEAINYYMCETTNDEQFVVIGQSMGCLVARYALTKMENDITWSADCNPEKRHNTRLFISNDGPHQGANIPMSLQNLYGKAFNDGGALDGVLQFLNTFSRYKLDFQNRLLNGTAVRQMLNAHYLTGEDSGYYTPDPLHDALFSELETMGYPTYCKNVALSNGALDGTLLPDRIANDHFLYFNNHFQYRVLGLTYSTDLWLDLRTNPEDYGLLYSMGHTRTRPELQLVQYGIRIGEDIIGNSDEKYGYNLRPYCVSSGGHVVSSGNFDFTFSVPTYLGIPWVLEFSSETVLHTDGFCFSLIPTASSLDFNSDGLGPDLDLNYLQFEYDALMENTPFDVVIARAGENANHEDFLNPSLVSIITNDTVYYSDNRTKKRLLNAEIGDNEIYLENANIDYSATLSIIDNIYVGRAPYYEYPTPIIRTLFTPDVYAISKNAEYEGVEYLQGFYNGESNAVENIGSYNMPECDFNPSYIKQRVEPTSQDNTNRYLVYPTWLTPKEQIVIALPSDTETMCTLFSIYGNIVYKTNLIQRENRITLPNYILPGSYLLTLQSKDGDTYNSPILVYK